MALSAFIWSIFPQDCPVFKHPQKMSDFSNVYKGKGCLLSFMEKCDKRWRTEKEAKWPWPKLERGKRPPLLHLVLLGRGHIYLGFSFLKAKYNVQIIHVHSIKN